MLLHIFSVFLALVIKACLYKPTYLVNFGKKLKAPSVLYYVCHI